MKKIVMLMSLVLVSSCLYGMENKKKVSTDDLYTALKHGQVDEVKKLLKATGALVNCTRDDGATPLHMASYYGDAAMVNELFKFDDIEVNCSMKNGETPLLIASLHKHVEVVKALLTARDIEVDRSSKNGTTPLLAACRQGHLEVVALLVVAGADITITGPGSMDAKDTAEYYGSANIIEYFEQLRETKILNADVDN